MAFTRSHYDSCAYDMKEGDNKNIFYYDVFLPKFDMCTGMKCKSNGEADKQFIGSRVDLESDLKNQTRMSSLCPSKKFQPCSKENPAACAPNTVITPVLCERTMVNWDGHLPKNRLYDISFKKGNITCNK